MRLFFTPQSSADGIHPDDLLGFKAVKKFLWDKRTIENTHVYYRRKNRDGEWLWLKGFVVASIDDPVPGFILQEARVVSEEQETAKKINRLTRICALIAKAVDDAFSYNENEDPLKGSSSNSTSTFMPIPDMQEEIKMLGNILNQSGEYDPLHIQSLLNAIGCNRVGESNSVGSDDSGSEKDSTTSLSETRSCMIDAKPSIRQTISIGPRGDFSKINLLPEEVKLISVVLSGELSVYKLADQMFDSSCPAEDANGMLEKLNVNDHRQVDSNNIKNPFLKGDNFDTRRLSYQSSKGSMLSVNSFSSSSNVNLSEHQMNQPVPQHLNFGTKSTPPLVSLNFSCSMIGNAGIVALSEILCSNTTHLRCLDISFCGIQERGLLALCRSLVRRRKRGLPSLQGLILTGNVISYRSARDLGQALCVKKTRTNFRLQTHHLQKEGYLEDDESDEDVDDEADDFAFGSAPSFGSKRSFLGTRRRKNSKREKISHNEVKVKESDPGIQLLHLSSTSLNANSLSQLLLNLGQASQLREIDLSSNNFGIEGIAPLAEFLEASGAMPHLDRLNISNNHIGDDGLAKITRVISKRKKTSLVDVHLSFNEIESGGTSTLMNKLLSRNVVSLALDNNLLGDAGCQLVAASLTSMHQLSKLNLSFNQIGSRGVTTLMRALVGCESLTFLGLSGNVMKINGAIAMGFALAQHPRMKHLELFNCCLSQVAQCHIVTGIISNRLVPLTVLDGFRVGPPMAAIGALDPVGQHLGNTECFTIRRNVQMKAMIQWVRESRNKEADDALFQTTDTNYSDFQSLDFVTPGENHSGSPNQNAFMRMLEWLSRIPFDEDELSILRQYFYDADDGSPDGLRGSNGKINLKYRGDLLAALGSGMLEEMKDDEKNIIFPQGSDVGLNIDGSREALFQQLNNPLRDIPLRNSIANTSQASSLSQQSLSDSNSKSSKCKARITMFPKFFEKLDLLKSNAQEMMNNELDPAKQDIIAQQFAEASLILLRQLRYQCMSSGLDGWRHGKIRRKVLIVDDSMVTRKLVGRAFEKANFIVDTAENGEEGVRMMKESVYDIAFMDIDMPVMNGFDATKALREWEDSKRPGARQPICALTATYVDDFQVHELMKFKEAGLDVMESKPCNIPRLFKVVDDVSPLFSDLSINVTKPVVPQDGK